MNTLLEKYKNEPLSKFGEIVIEPEVDDIFDQYDFNSQKPDFSILIHLLENKLSEELSLNVKATLDKLNKL